jgi:hypothetical protein
VAIANWLSIHDEDSAAIVLECGARDAGAAAWRLQAPLRARSRPGDVRPPPTVP